MSVNESLSRDKIEQLIKNKQYAELDSIVKTVGSVKVKNTMVNLAAWHNDTTLLKSLLASGCDIESNHINGETPLLVAAFNRSFDVMKLLLNADADIFATNANGWSVLKFILHHMSDVPYDVHEHLLRALRRQCNDANEAVAIVEEINCPLELIVFMRDPIVTRLMLRRRIVDREESELLVKNAMKTYDMENLNVVTHFGKGSDRRRIFFDELVEMLQKPDLDVQEVRPFVEILIDWNVINVYVISTIVEIFETGSDQVVRLFLENDIDVFVKRRFKENLIVYLFNNTNVDAVDIVFGNEKFDVNSRARDGYTALHFAASNDNEKQIRFLLDSGANPNQLDEFGWPPLLQVSDARCLSLFLRRRNVDAQFVTHNGVTAIETLDSATDDAKQLFISHLVLLEARGVRLRSEIQLEIDSSEVFSDYYKESNEQIEWMKSCRITRNLSLFTVIGERVEISSRLIRDESVVLEKIMEFKQKSQLLPYYYDEMENNLERIREIKILRPKAAVVVAESIGIFRSDHLVVEKIISFLTYEDLILYK